MSSITNQRKSTLQQQQIDIDNVSLIDQTENEQRHLKAKSDYVNAKISYMQTEEYRFKLIKSKLKAVTRTSALLSGFAMVAMVELALDLDPGEEKSPLQWELEKYIYGCNFTSHLNTTSESERVFCGHIQEQYGEYMREHVRNNAAKQNTVPPAVLIIYAIITSLLVGIHMLALMISTCILPQVEATTIESLPSVMHMSPHGSKRKKSGQNSQATGSNQLGSNSCAVNNQNNDSDEVIEMPSLFRPSPYAVAAATTTSSFLYTTSKDKTFKFIDKLASPDKQFHYYIELAWISSTVLGIFLFLVEISLVCFIKFYPLNAIAAIAGGIILMPIFAVFVIFTFTFYKRIAGQKINLTKEFINQVDRNLMPLHHQVV